MTVDRLYVVLVWWWWAVGGCKVHPPQFVTITRRSAVQTGMLPERRISAAAELDGVMHACAAGQVCAPAAQHKVSKAGFKCWLAHYCLKLQEQ